MPAAHPLPLIPVLDLQGGQVVRAVRGERARYRPLAGSALAGAGPEPVATARALLAACGGRPRLYVADLDALQGGAPQAEALARLFEALPGLELWLDGGFAGPEAAARLQARLGVATAAGAPLAADAGPGLRAVYASESLDGPSALAEAFPDAAARAAGLLSLDRRGATPLDRAGCAGRPQDWPATLILMTLERVGSAEGPALAALAEARARAPQAAWVGAGGLRHAADAAAAQAAGAQAWLVASALHAGTWPGGAGRPAAG